MRPLLLAVLFLLRFTCAIDASEGSVVHLGLQNFYYTLDELPHMAVLFTNGSGRCENSTRWETILTQTAEVAKNISGIGFGVVNCSEESVRYGLCEKYLQLPYRSPLPLPLPAFRLFSEGVALYSFRNTEPTVDALEAFLRLHTRPKVHFVNDEATLERMVEEHEATVVGFFETMAISDFQSFARAAAHLIGPASPISRPPQPAIRGSNDTTPNGDHAASKMKSGIVFAAVNNSSIFPHYAVSTLPAIHFYHQGLPHTPAVYPMLKNKLTRKRLVEWVVSQQTMKVWTLTSSRDGRVFAAANKKLLTIYIDAAGDGGVLRQVRHALQRLVPTYYPKDYIFAVRALNASSVQSELYRYTTQTGAAPMPLVLLLDFSSKRHHHLPEYVMDLSHAGRVTEDDITKFISSVEDGRWARYIRKQMPPAASSDGLVRVVYDTWTSTIYDDSKDCIVLFCSSEEAYVCATMEQRWSEFARKLPPGSPLTVGFYDLAFNDPPPGVSVHNIPTVRFYPATDKGVAMRSSSLLGNQSEKEIVQLILQNNPLPETAHLLQLLEEGRGHSDSHTAAGSALREEQGQVL